jgi:glycosyltransferase involved in cell wall biosynthesis
VDRYVANSRTTAERVRRYLGREASILHPPVELDRFGRVGIDQVGDHYAVLAELMSHKRIDIAVEAFTRLGLPLVVIGDGPEGRRLRRLAGPSVRFTGRIPDEQVAALLARSRALVVTATEEFGIAAVEALAAGRPVIALDEGGVRESVEPGVTGAFYERNDAAALAEAVLGFDALAVDPAACRAAAERFSVRHFQDRLAGIVAEATSDERAPRAGERSRLQSGLLHGARRPRVVR